MKKANPMKNYTLVIASCLMMLLSTVSFASPNQTPIANFSTSTVSGCAPLLVTFVDQSTGNPTSWKWDLGNGVNSILQNPSAVYTNPGIYNVKLIVQNTAGKDSIIKINYITVFAKPTISFSSATTSACVNSTIYFTDNCTAGSGTIFSRQWDFGDGTLGNNQNPSHQYVSSGVFNISLKVTNSNGCVESLTKINYINIDNKPTAAFINSTATNCSAPFEVTFQNSSTGTTALSYNWNFGDGTFSTAINPAHTYSTPGNYTVKLFVNNTNGCIDSVIKNNLVQIANNYSMFSCVNSICTKSTLLITNSSSPAPISTYWDFGDSTSSTDFSPIKIFTTSDTFTIRMINDFGTCRDTVIKNIIINPTPITSFSATTTSACIAPLNTQFNNSTLNANTYKWKFGDGSISTIINPTHTYNSITSYSVTLIATSNEGCIDSLTKSNYIILNWPVATITNIPKSGCAPFTCTLNPNVVGGDSVVNYMWDFGDGYTSSIKNPTHTYYNRGAYNIKLKIITASGCYDTVYYSKAIKVGNKPHPDFSANPTSSCASSSIAFTDLTPSTDSVNQWLWMFGDGATSTSKNPRHKYNDTSSSTNPFDVKLIVYDNGCSDTLLQQDLIQIFSPIANFSSTINCINRLNRTFVNKSKGGDSWFWTFGDGSSSILKNPTHDFLSPGTYNVKLIVYNNAAGCSDSITTSINIINEVADFSTSEDAICKSKSTTVNVTGINTQNYTSFNWDFGDGVTGSGSSLTKIYFNAGIYTIKLFSKDKNGCKDTLIKNSIITVNGPTAAFNTSISNVCSNTTVNFSDASFSDGRNQLVKWIWNFGDGVIDTLTYGNAVHSYSTAGNYTIGLKVFDQFGCANTISKPNQISVSHPTAKFITTDSISCPNSTITFLNKSIGSGLTYNWNFGDGSNSTVKNPTHTYGTVGNYTVKLIVTSSMGCQDSMSIFNAVKIIIPTANFSVSDSLGNCPPLVVNFNNLSNNYLTQTWNFGDGNTTNIIHPSHFYSVSGNFVAKLIVKSNGGCIDSAQKTIIVHGPRGSFSYPNLPGCIPLNINFSASAVNTNYFVWDFGDGNTTITNNSNQSHDYISSGSFIPKLLLKDSTGCVVSLTGSDTIKTSGISAAFTFNNNHFCDIANIQFNHSNSSQLVATTYAWDFGDGTISTIENPLHIYTSPGIYFPSLIAKSSFGCIDSMVISSPIIIGSSPIGVINRTDNGCTGVTINFKGIISSADSSNVTWSWNFGNGNSSIGTNPMPQTYNNAGTYYVTGILTNNTGCSDTVNTTVEAYPFPATYAGIDTIVCKGSVISLNASGADIYEWAPSNNLSCYDCPNPTFTATDEMNYIVTGKTIHGCSNKDTINIKVRYPFNMMVSSKQTMCNGSSKILNASGADHYSWSPTTGLDKPNAASTNASPTISTIYRVIGIDDKHCFSDTAYVPVTVYNYPTVEAGEDKTINVGQTVELIPQISADVTIIKWTPSEALSRSTQGGIVIKPIETTTYNIEVSNEGGCRTSDQVTINVLCNGANLFIPNTFSPNNDGMNDIFFPRGTGIFIVKSAKVYTRWGQVVYEKTDFNANDISKGWDGKFKGTLLNADVYIYVITVKCDNNSTLTYKGNVSLLK